jgi:5,10-methylenetetrahydrofolate reductase
MILKNAMDLTNSIKKYRQDMDQLVKMKGISHPDVKKFGQQLEKRIMLLKKYKKI